VNSYKRRTKLPWWNQWAESHRYFEIHYSINYSWKLLCSSIAVLQ